MRLGVSRLAGLGTVYDDQTLYTLARAAGFPPDTAVKMVAIAQKESGGNTAAYNGTPPDDSYGLWQINMYGNLGPARLSQFGISDKTQLFNPVVNAQAAYQIWGGNDNNLNIAWAINDNGINQSRFLANLPSAQQAANVVDGTPVTDASTSNPDNSDDSSASFDLNLSTSTTYMYLLGAAVLAGILLID